MSQQLTQWMQKLCKEITEGVPAARRVRLQSDGQVFETWEPIVGPDSVVADPAEWAKDAETLLTVLKAELPKRRCQLMFIAEDASGGTISTVMRTVMGDNPAASDLGTQNGAKALADALASVAKTMDATLQSSQKVMEFLVSYIEKLHGEQADHHEFFMAIRKAELENAQEESAVKSILVEQLKQFGPLAADLAAHLLEKAQKSSAAKAALKGAAEAVTEAATAATNGAKVS